MRMTAAMVAVAGAVLAFSCAATGDAPGLEDRLDGLVAEATGAAAPYGVALHVDSPRLGVAWEGAGGLADPAAGVPMTAEHPVRIASNTKTYVAAAVLRAWEEGLLGLDDPVRRHLPAELTELLERGGYSPGAITVRHLLTHTSGLDDHGDGGYAERILADPQHRWTRAEQVRRCVEQGRPRGAPGEVYRYSDTGYVLLGAILERVTGRPLPGAVWGLLDRERLGLGATWFETLEPAPPGLPPRAHQFFGEVDVHGFDPSFDLWGGGGIVATVGDLARFTRALFTGEVFRHPGTLAIMLTTGDGVRAADDAGARSLPPGAYRMGVWVVELERQAVYRHTGFWCTSASWVPSLDLVVTATVDQHEAAAVLNDLVDGAIRLAGRQPPPALGRG